MVKKYLQKMCASSGSEVSTKHDISSDHERKKFKCIRCNASFSQKENLKAHITKVHEGMKPKKCNVCKSYFSTQLILNKHLASVHEREKPYDCKICGKSFVSKQTLNAHISPLHFINVKFVIKPLSLNRP